MPFHTLRASSYPSLPGCRSVPLSRDWNSARADAEIVADAPELVVYRVSPIANMIRSSQFPELCSPAEVLFFDNILLFVLLIPNPCPMVV